MKVCPDCRESDGLWRGVTIEGWQSLDATLKPTGERDVEWSTAEPDGTLGCSCGWEGSELATLGIDGEPLPEIHPAQQVLVPAEGSDGSSC